MDLTKNKEVLTQLAHERSDEAARMLALALKSALDNDDKVELVRVASVVKELASPLTPEFKPLVFYANAVAKWAGGDLNGAISELKFLKNSCRRFRPGCYSVTLSKRHGCLKIMNVLLDMPSEIFAQVTQIFQHPRD